MSDPLLNLEQKKLEFEIAKLREEKKKAEDDNARAAQLHKLQLEKLKESDEKGESLLRSPAFLGCAATVIAAFFAFLPQIQNFRAVYNKAVIEEETRLLEKRKEVLEAEQKYQTKINDGIISSNVTLLVYQNNLSKTNADILGEVARQKEANDQLAKDLADLRVAIQRSTLERDEVLGEKTNLLATVESLRSESREKELKLVENDREHALELVETHIAALQKDADGYRIEWMKEPAAIENLLINSKWRTNIFARLSKIATATNSNFDLRTLFAIVSVLYSHDTNNTLWKEELLKMVRSGKVAKYHELGLAFDKDELGVTNLLGRWRNADRPDFLAAWFQSICNSSGDPETRQETISGAYFVLQRQFGTVSDRHELQNLATNFCNIRAIFHGQALLDLNTLSSPLSSMSSGIKFLELYDPVLLAAMWSKKLFEFPAPVDMANLPRTNYRYYSIAQVLGYYRILENDPGLHAKLQRLGMPTAITANGKTNVMLNPADWKTWCLNSNNIPLIDAAWTSDLTTWDSLIATRLKDK